MDDSDLLDFTPVPVRARRDGWTPRRQYSFIQALVRGCTPGKAAALLGMTRKTAYELRTRPGAEGFAAAWTEAVARARANRIAARAAGPAGPALQGEWHPRLRHGRLIGWEHRPASARSPSRLKRADRQNDRLAPGVKAGGYERRLAAEGDRSEPHARRERQASRVPPRRGT
ncbi:MAG TPA: hypothetical protein VF547_04200 [Allosphingosinicella sp.]